jgi:hypothetical protein
MIRSTSARQALHLNTGSVTHSATSGRVEMLGCHGLQPALIIESDGTRRQGTTVRPHHDWDLDLRDREMSFVRIDHRTSLQFGDIAIVIEWPFTMRVDGESYELDEPRELGPLLAQYPDILMTGTVDEDGTLRLIFGRGWTIDVPPDPHYEAWQIEGPGKNLVVCPPDGGTLAIWIDDASDESDS